MLTSCSLVSFLPFRSEFQLDHMTEGRFLDDSVQPIDAPDRICAGSYVLVKAVSYDGEYGLPSAIDRVKS